MSITLGVALVVAGAGAISVVFMGVYNVKDRLPWYMWIPPALNAVITVALSILIVDMWK